MDHLGEDFSRDGELTLMLVRRHPKMDREVLDLLTKLATEINTSFTAGDSRTRVETPMSLRTVLDRYPAGLPDVRWF